MQKLIQRILKDAVAEPDGIIRVDTFLNHMLDIHLIDQMGKEIARIFRDEKVTKVLTAEASGIPIACFTARAFDVPAVFARKYSSGHIDETVYQSGIFSDSLQHSHVLRVSKSCLDEEDNILIVDDFLSNGMSALALVEIASKAGASIAGVAVAIEKSYKEGGRTLRRMGVRVEALATVEAVEDGRIIIEDGD
jgi:xanthine phosphoribosyltransferase